MDITPFIRELLFGHDCVIVPGFGGLIGNYTPASIDKNTGTFYPPVKQISFNRNLNTNDGLLIGSVSGATGVNYGDARTLVEEFVTNVRKHLGNGEKVVFDHIGSFINNQEGNIQFEPDRSSNYLLDSYGFEPFQCLPLEGYDLRKHVVRHIQKDSVKRISSRKVLWRAAVIVPLLSAIVAVPLTTDIFKSKIASTSLNPLVTTELEMNEEAVNKSVSNSEGKAIDNTLAEAATTVGTVITQPVNTEPVENIADVESVEYTLITGSFKSEENARMQVEALKSDGFNPEILVSSNGFYRVSAMVCNDLGIAMTKKDSIAKKFPGTWISKKK